MMTPSVSERSTDWNIKWVTCCSTGGWAQQRNQIQSSVNTLRHLEVHIWLCWCSSWWWKSSQEVRIPDLQAAHVRGTPRLGGSQLQRTVENGGRSHDSSEDERYYKVHCTVNDFKNTNNHTHQFRQNAALQRWGQRICAVQQGQWLQYGGEVSAHVIDFDLEQIMYDVADAKLRRTAWWHVRRAGWRDRSSWRLSERNTSMSEVTTEKQGSSRPDTRGYVWS